MKKIELFIITMLFVISYAYADGYRTDEDHWEKVRQMDEMAERFKAETGFMGEINPDSPLKHLTGFRGKFPDIPFSANADSVTFRQACERIVDRILPYTSANRSQLSMSRISKSVFGYTTEYYQQVGGYRVESRGLILITFDEGMNRFSISNGTVELPDVDVSAIITLEEAIRIANLVYFKSSNPRVQPRKVTLEFTNGKNQNNKNYYLCYNLYMGTVVCVDAVTGDVRYTWSREKVHTGSVLIKGAVYEKEYVNHDPSPLGNLPLSGVLVSSDSFVGSTDDNGVVIDDNGVVIVDESSLNGLSAQLEEIPFFKVTVYPDSTTPKTADQYNLGSPPMEIYFSDDTCYSPNVYYHAAHQRSELESMFNSASDMIFGLAIVAGDTTQAHGGYFEPSHNTISLSNSAGKLSHAVRHEVSHCYVYETLGDYLNYHSSQGSSMDYWAMDEAFAVYLPCSVIEQPECIYGDPLEITSLLAVSNHTSSISTLYYGNANVDESLYSKYYFRYPLASAWWALRSDLHFGSTAVDTLLIAGLGIVKTGIVEGTNNTYRYKPRYFYNILMSRVDTDNKSWPFNPKQAAIDNMYSDRGFHFYPKVQSVASADVTTPLGRESYNVLDSVYVHISNYPQNTYVQVFVVEDRDYLNVGDNGIAIPAPYEVDGNPVSGIFKTDGNGKWAGGIPFSRLLPQGDYDIIVNNMVNPTAPNNNPTDPDNTLHLAFKNDYIIDGVDGLDGPGFTKTGTGDIVVALDFSSSMSGYGAQLAQMVKALEQSMIDSERINVFGFTEGTASQGWIEDGITDLIGDDSSFLEVTQIESTNITCDNNLLIWRKNI